MSSNAKRKTIVATLVWPLLTTNRIKERKKEFLENLVAIALADLFSSFFSFILLVYFLFQTLRFTFDINEEPPVYFNIHSYPF